jgi:hypothetical protein
MSWMKEIESPGFAASGGSPWTVIPVGDRRTYMEALENASVSEDIVPFTDFLAGLVKRTPASGPEGFFIRDGGDAVECLPYQN